MENIGSDSGTKLGESGESLVLGFDMNFADLYQRTGLLKLDHAFLDFLKDSDPDLYTRLDHARSHSDSLNAKDESNLLIEVAPLLDDFISKLFAHQDAWTKTHNSTDYLINMAMEFGMPLERAKMALNDKEIMRRVLTGLVSARDELNVKSTPTFFINDQMYPGLIEYDDFVRVLDSF